MVESALPRGITTSWTSNRCNAVPYTLLFNIDWGFFYLKILPILVDFRLLLLSFLSPVTSRITNPAKPSGHVAFHSLAIFWTNNVSIAARASHVFARCNRLKGLMAINDYKLKTKNQLILTHQRPAPNPPLWVYIDKATIDFHVLLPRLRKQPRDNFYLKFLNLALRS
jgi:hypothetical protein